MQEFIRIIRAVGLRVRYSQKRLDRKLHSAAITGNIGLVGSLIAAGADIHADAEQALRAAAIAGHDGVVRTLIGAGADVHARNDVALRAAAILGHLGVVKELIGAGANIRANADQALHEAATSGYVSVVTEVLDAADCQGSTAVDEDAAAMGVFLRAAALERKLGRGR